MSEEAITDFAPQCPLPIADHGTVQMAHGGGGRAMKTLIEQLFLPAFSGQKSSDADAPHDSAVRDWAGGRLAFTTDTFVVRPRFFPGGDIGKLAVYGTANDLAMAGATPKYLSCGLILEEGLPLTELAQIVESMKAAAEEVGVEIVTGDTKVVDRGKGDGVFINTAGVGVVADGIDVSPQRVQAGDVVLVSGDLGRHGIAIMSVREGVEFEGALESDCGSLVDLVSKLVRELGQGVHCLRDLTRGGLSAALNEIADHRKLGVELNETQIPVAEPVAGACEMLGLDPLYVANEGRLVAFVAADVADRALEIFESHPATCQPAKVGVVTDGHPGTVLMKSALGADRIVDLLSGEQMPRIC